MLKAGRHLYRSALSPYHEDWKQCNVSARFKHEGAYCAKLSREHGEERIFRISVGQSPETYSR